MIKAFFLYLDWYDRNNWANSGTWCKSWHMQLCLFGSDE